MRKIITAALAALLTLGLCACGSAKSHDVGTRLTGITFGDTYLIYSKNLKYTGERLSGYVNMPYKFNVLTGTSTPLCTDPLCDHSPDSGCPFDGVTYTGMLYYEDGKLYYIAQVYTDPTSFITNTVALKSYDLESGHTELLYQFEAPENWGGNRDIGCGYFWMRYNKSDTVEASAFRVRLSDGAFEQIDADAAFPAAYYGDEYLFYDTNKVGISTAIYSADLDGGNRRDLLAADNISIAFLDNITDDTFIYATPGEKAVTDGGGTKSVADYDVQTLWLFDIKSGETEKLADGFGSSYIAQAGDYIYYTKAADDPPLRGYDKNEGANKYNRSGGILWRLDTKTGVEEKAFELPAYDLDGVELCAVGDRVVIGYANVDYDDYKVSDTGRGDFYDYKKENGRIVFDPDTDEYKIYPEDAQ